MLVWTREIPPTFIILFFVGLLAVLLLFRLTAWSREATAAVALVGLGIFTTLGISVISAISSYWILSRQWVGGMAITTIGVVWLLAVVYRTANEDGFKSIEMVVVGVGAYISLVGIFQIWGSMTQIPFWISAQNEITTQEIDLAESKINSGDSDIDLIEAANLNIIQGNDVWPGYAEYYAGYRR
jgi:membrane protease YdiL (CAAX protease family)